MRPDVLFGLTLKHEIFRPRNFGEFDALRLPNAETRLRFWIFALEQIQFLTLWRVNREHVKGILDVLIFGYVLGFLDRARLVVFKVNIFKFISLSRALHSQQNGLEVV